MLQNNAKWKILKDQSKANHAARAVVLKELYQYYNKDDSTLRNNANAGIKFLEERLTKGESISFETLSELVTAERQKAEKYEDNAMAQKFSEANIARISSAALISAFLQANP